MRPVPCATANNSTSADCETTWRPTCRRPTDRSTVEQFPHGHSNLTYLIRTGRPGMGPAPAALWQSRQDGPRHGPRVPHPLPALPCLSPAPAPLLYCEDESDPRSPVLPDGAAQGSHPPRHASARPADPARAGAAALRDARRQHGRSARARLPRRRAGRPGQAPGLRRAPGHRLDQALPGCPHRRRPRPRANDRLAGRATGRPSRPRRP